MAKGSGESKLALVGVVTLAVALAGVLLVKEPLRSSRPVGTGLDLKQATGEQSVRARLWEDDYKIRRSQLPTYGQMLKDQIETTETADQMQASIEHGYSTRLY